MVSIRRGFNSLPVEAASSASPSRKTATRAASDGCSRDSGRMQWQGITDASSGRPEVVDGHTSSFELPNNRPRCELWNEQEQEEQEECEEEDRLSTAAPSSVGVANEISSRARWADLADSETEGNEVSECRTKSPRRRTSTLRWSDLADDSEDESPNSSPGHAASSSNEVATKELNDGEWAKKDSANWWKKPAQESWWQEKKWEQRSWSRDESWNRWETQPNQDEGSWQPAQAEGSWWHERQQRQHQKYQKQGEGSSARNRLNTGRNKNSPGKKDQCQFIIGIEEEPQFRVCRKLLGPQGQHMKDIALNSNAKLRIRGKGSKFLEGPEHVESKDPLMLCVSAPDSDSYAKAKQLVTSLLEDVYAQFKAFKKSQGSVPPEVNIVVHEGPRPGSF
eukprot:TRINITY_DN3511_c1_g1_i1.p1 TRINITY_DN3511_c1_g1~~TRINITY_DN3511_c1_g1_i1.p1  ORF type:complete len:393 (+),score=86.57 TRINITY_DN3511_c1_g1_i1:205-1383(+)